MLPQFQIDSSEASISEESAQDNFISASVRLRHMMSGSIPLEDEEEGDNGSSNNRISDPTGVGGAAKVEEAPTPALITDEKPSASTGQPKSAHTNSSKSGKKNKEKRGLLQRLKSKRKQKESKEKKKNDQQQRNQVQAKDIPSSTGVVASKSAPVSLTPAELEAILPHADKSDPLAQIYLPKTQAEKDGVKAILDALTPQEIDAMSDDGMPLRHFRAEKSNVPLAIEKLKNTLQWRKEFEVERIIKSVHNDGQDPEFDKMIREENASSKMYVRGHDAGGRALIYMRSDRENTHNETNNMRNLVWTMEKALACSGRSTNSKDGRPKPVSDKLCLVIDFEHFKLSTAPPMSSSKKTLDILQNHYPERMYRAYVVNPTFMFRAFWRIVKPFIDPVTKEKIVFCTGTDSVANDVADPATLEPSVGGTDPNIKEFDPEEYVSLPFDVAFDT